MAPSPRFLKQIKRRISGTSSSGSYTVTVTDSTSSNVEMSPSVTTKSDLNTSLNSQTSSTEYHSVESLNVEDLADDVQKLRSEFLQQNVESRKLFDEMEERLSLLQNQSEMFGNEQDERVTIKSDSWEFKEKMPDSCDGSKLSSDLQNLGEKDAENEDQTMLEKLQYRVKHQQELITRLEIMKEALLMQNKMLLIDRKRLEDERVTILETIESRERDIEELKKLLNASDLGIGYIGYVLLNLKQLLIEPRSTLKSNIQGLQNILHQMTEAENTTRSMTLSKALALKSNTILEFINNKI